ncbi:MAG: Xylose isomerase domain protein barrel [Rhizobacter sp.]|nr:Xylose isomerase domain protein barrel [Rhizobacter sp.]
MAFSAVISLTSFGAAEVRRHGQLYFAQLCKQAGADGVEVRGELLVAAQTELPQLAQAVRDLNLSVLFSCPDPLFLADGSLDDKTLGRAIEATQKLGATRMKMSIGGYLGASHGAASIESIGEVARMLADGGVEMVVENDQTVSAGSLPAMQQFFAEAAGQGLDLGMTFDVGNWHTAGECPLQAAQALGDQVVYVHTKGVAKMPRKWAAVPLADSIAPWRAILRALPCDVPWAIEYPLIGDDLVAVTRAEIDHLRGVAAHAAAFKTSSAPRLQSA